jgi:hypothetical protein
MKQGLRATVVRTEFDSATLPKAAWVSRDGRDLLRLRRMKTLGGARLSVLVLLLLAAGGELAAQASGAPLGEAAPAPVSERPMPARGYRGRALYPWWDVSDSINTDDRAVARPSWFTVENSLWSPDRGGPAWQSRLDLREAWFSYSFDYTQRFADGSGADYVSEYQWARVMLGGNLPLKSADLGLSLGAGLLDDHGAFNASGGLHAEASGTWWPLWPLALSGRADLGMYEGGRELLDWRVEGRLHLWRPMFLTIGYRGVSVLADGGFGGGSGAAFDTANVEGRGLYVGITFNFSGFTTMFERPRNGRGNGPLSLIGG